MSWYTPTLSTHRRDIHYTFEIDNNKQNNDNEKQKQISSTHSKKRKVESQETSSKQKTKPKPKTTIVKVKHRPTSIKKTIKNTPIDKHSFI